MTGLHYEWGLITMDIDPLILFMLLNFLVIILAVVPKSKLEGTKWKIAMIIVAVITVVSGIVWRLLHGGF